MKQQTLGILGGMSWESTQTYYRLLNEGIKAELGGLHSADLVIRSVDFAPIEDDLARGDWQTLAKKHSDSAMLLKNAGAKGILIATNTMHKVAGEVQKACGLPLLHIADATANAIQEKGLTTVALLGTNATMVEDFYQQRLIDSGLNVLIPDADERADIHRIIFEELCRGVITEVSKKRYVDIIERLATQGAEGVILGCTEIGLLLTQDDVSIPTFDTTEIHARAGVAFLLAR